MFKQANVSNIARVHLSLLISVFCFLFTFSSRAQANLNITDYGATGDVVQFAISTVSNSTVVSVTGTNVFSSSDVGKVIEVFGAGPWVTYGDLGVVVTQQDIVCLITNVSDGTNLSLSIPCGWTMNTYCVVGSNNGPAFQSAINDASSVIASGQYTNVTINIPAGTYLMTSSNVLDPNYVMDSISDTHPALIISSGGITLQGDPGGGTVLMGCGAGMEHLVNSDLSWISPDYAPYCPMRDTLVFCQGPVANNQYPLVFENLTLDGGVQQGAQPYNYWELIQGNGEGWDTTHHAVADFDGYVTYRMNQMKVFTNCVFQHWRGEILICWTGCMTNDFNDIENCVFQDGNATADNMYYGQRINNCTFNNVGKVMEYYQENGYTNSSIMENCIVTNISETPGPGDVHVDCAITGATTNRTMPSFTFFNNQFYDNVGMEFFSLNAAENISFISNSFTSSGSAINLTGIGQQPTDGAQVWYMTNILVVGNSFSCASPLSIGYGDVEDLLCSNNTGFSVTASIGYAANIVLSGNSGYNMGNDYYDVMSGPVHPGSSSQIASGQYMVDLTNNNWVVSTPYTIDGGNPFPTNWISYGNGRVHELQASGSKFYLDDTKPKLIPIGAILQVYARTWSGRDVTNFYTSARSHSGRMTIANGGPPVTFYWNGSRWENESVKFTVSATIACPFLSLQFKSPAVDGGGNTITSWSWDFGDGSTSTEQNPSHVYTSLGTFHPVLSVVDKRGLAPATEGPAINVINPALRFSANRTNGVSRFTVEFKSPKTDNTGVAIESWLWNFGDGSTSTMSDPSHTYTNPGPYVPSLIVSNAVGLSPLTSGPGISVTFPTVKFTASPTKGSVPLTVHFKSPATDSGGNKIVSWYWSFGDGLYSTNQSPSHTYSEGNFRVSLNVENAFNLNYYANAGPMIMVAAPNSSALKTEALATVTVNAPPMLSLSPSGNNMILAWPTNAASYTLQYSTDLCSGSWINVTSPPAVISGQNVVTNSIAGPQMFFRLTQ